MKNKLLFVPGIIMVVFGGIGIVSNLIGLATAGSLVKLMNSMMAYTEMNVDVDGIVGFLKFAAFIGLLGAVIYLVAGILGIKNAARPEKAQTCFIMGIILVVMCIINFVFAIITNSKMNALYESMGQTYSGGLGGAIAGLAIGLILPVLYLIGAMQNKKLSAGSNDFTNN